MQLSSSFNTSDTSKQVSGEYHLGDLLDVTSMRVSIREVNDPEGHLDRRKERDRSIGRWMDENSADTRAFLDVYLCKFFSFVLSSMETCVHWGKEREGSISRYDTYRRWSLREEKNKEEVEEQDEFFQFWHSDLRELFVNEYGCHQLRTAAWTWFGSRAWARSRTGTRKEKGEMNVEKFSNLNLLLRTTAIASAVTTSTVTSAVTTSVTSAITTSVTSAVPSTVTTSVPSTVPSTITSAITSAITPAITITSTVASTITSTIVVTISSSSTVARDMTRTWTIVACDTTAAAATTTTTATSTLWAKANKHEIVRISQRDPYRLSAFWRARPFNNEVFPLMFPSIFSFDRCLKVNESRNSTWSEVFCIPEAWRRNINVDFLKSLDIPSHPSEWIKRALGMEICVLQTNKGAPPSSVKRILGDMTRCSS